MSFLDAVPPEISSSVNVKIESFDEENNEDTKTPPIDSTQCVTDADSEDPLDLDDNYEDNSTSIAVTVPRTALKRTRGISNRKRIINRKRRLNKKAELLDQFKKKNEARGMFLQNSTHMESDDDDLESFAIHIKNVLKKLPPVLKIRAKQEIFDVLTKHEIIAVESFVN